LSENLPFFPKPYHKKHLQQILSEIEAKERITQHALHNLEHRLLLDLVYDINGIALAVTDAQGRYVRVNRTFLEIMGYEESEIIGQSFTLVVDPHFRAAAQQLYDQSFRGDLKEIPMEWQVYRKDGQAISIWVTSSTVDLQSQDRLKMTTFLLKNQGRIQQYQHEKSFIEQLFQRLNQHYYLLSSLLFGHTQQILQSEYTYRIFLEGLFKLRSIALAQEQHQNSLEINLSHYLQSLCNQLHPIMQQQQTLVLHTDFEPSVWGQFKEVLPLGLMLSELLFNACHHAFHAQTLGAEIKVRLYQEAQQRCLSIEDNGCGLAPDFSIEANNTPGMQLLTNLSQQLQAKLQILPHQGCKILICW
jgi:PAS domain S-box-containing protein